jgi:hypothetical protein
MTLFTDIWSHDTLRIKLLAEHPLAQRPQLLGVGFVTRIVSFRNNGAIFEVSRSFLCYSLVHVMCRMRQELVPRRELFKAASRMEHNPTEQFSEFGSCLRLRME